MANPDFTQMVLKTAPEHAEAEWKALFEKEAGKSFYELTRRTMEHIPVNPFYNH